MWHVYIVVTRWLIVGMELIGFGIPQAIKYIRILRSPELKQQHFSAVVLLLIIPGFTLFGILLLLIIRMKLGLFVKNGGLDQFLAKMYECL